MIINTKKPVLIIDGNLYLYRSYYTFLNYISIIGEPSGAIYGMLKMIYWILKKYHDSKKMIVIFDSFQITFRKKLFPDYKKNRPHMPNSLFVQIEPLIKEIKKIGIATLSIPGIEADDIIGSLAHLLQNEGEKVLIISHDKDMLQLVTNNIHVLQKNNKVIKPLDVEEKYGIRPIEFIDFLALMGDSSDNIPGVPKIGKKTALILLHEFSNIKNIYNQIHKIPLLSFRNSKNIAITLKKNKDLAFLSYELAKINITIPININNEIKIKKSYIKKIFPLFKKYNYQKNSYF